MPEVRTIIFMAFLFYVFTGAIFFIIDFDKKRSSAVYWGSAMLTLALGVLLIGLRNMIPDYISVVLGNLAVVIGSSLFVFAICDFTDRETPIKTIIIIIVNYVLFFHFFPEPKYFAMRNIMHSFVGILLTLFAVYFLFRFSDTRFTSSKRFLIFLYLFSIVIIFFRALFLFHSESSLRFFDINIFNRVYFISVFFIPLITTFGFLLMLRQANTK